MTSSPARYLVPLVLLLLLLGVWAWNAISPDRSEPPGQQPVPADAPLHLAASSAALAASARMEDTHSSTPDARRPGIAPRIDWDKYPGSLESQAGRAFDTRDGVMALDIAMKLQECDIISRLMAPENTPEPPSRDVDIQAERTRRLQEYHRIGSQCQTIVGDPELLRRRLLDLAIEKQVPGAAAESFGLGARQPAVLQGVVRDAQAGEVKSLVWVASHPVALFGISNDARGAARYALELGQAEPSVGHLIRPYLDIAEASAVPLAGEPGPKFDHARLSAEARTEGRRIAERLVDRVKSGGDHNAPPRQPAASATQDGPHASRASASR